MSKDNGKTSTIRTAFGGFLIIIGVTLLGVFALSIVKILDVTVFMEVNFRTFFLLVLMMIGVIDLISGIILALR